MNILECLKAAKKHLATETVPENWDGKTKYVCFAVAEAYKEAYKEQHDTPWEDSAEARRYVQDKLHDLQCKFGIIYLVTFSEDLATAYLKSLGVKRERWSLQQARHLWLDSLIKELENGTA